MNKPINTLKSQSGAVLVISLIMLMLLTMIGLTGTQVTGLEEKMVGNSKDQNMALQYAEAGLRGGEANIETIVALSAFDGSGAFLGKDDPEPDYRDPATWTAAKSQVYDTGSSLVAAQPRYFIKYITTGDANTNARINICNYGCAAAGASISYFTVTARGIGAQCSNSQAYLRSYYGKRF